MESRSAIGTALGHGKLFPLQQLPGIWPRDRLPNNQQEFDYDRGLTGHRLVHHLIPAVIAGAMCFGAKINNTEGGLGRIDNPQGSLCPDVPVDGADALYMQ